MSLVPPAPLSPPSRVAAMPAAGVAEPSAKLLGLLELMTNILRRFAGLADQDVDAGIQSALAAIGEFVGVDRSYLFLIDDQGEYLRNTHEWCAPAIHPEIDNLQAVPFAEIHYWKDALLRGDSVYVPCVADLPDTRRFERDILRQQDVQSVLVVPLVGPDRLRGFIGFDAVRQAHAWSHAATLLLRAVADVFVGAIMRREAYLALIASERRYRALVRHSTDAVLILDTDFRLSYLSPSIERILGWRPDAWLGRRFFAACHPGDVDQIAAAFSAASATPGMGSAVPDHRLLHARNDWVWFLGTATDLRADPAIGGIVINAHDITQRKAAELALQHQALHDPLTGLPNRALLKDRLAQSIGHARRTGHLLAVVFIDLDHFKLINDAMGHQAGDRLLIDAAQRLLEILRAGDTVARFGGDEFVMVLEGNSDQPESLVSAAERILAAFERPFLTKVVEQVVTASAGLVIADGNADPDELLRDADAAMYLAKERGRACLQRFDAPMRDHLLDRLELVSDLRRAEQEGQLLLHYQPLFDARSRRLRGCEALLRWQHPRRGMVGPTRFIPAAEETGLIVPIGAWVLNEALRQMRAWLDAWPSAGKAPASGTGVCAAAGAGVGPDGQGLFVAVNLSVRQLNEPRLVETVRALLERWRLPPAVLCLELTESSLMAEPDHCVAVLSRLRDLGVSLAIDDFGTGYSSLAYLRDLPVSKLKIDRSFVASMQSDHGGRNIVAAIRTLAREFGMETVAEGVETEAQYQALRLLGCDMVQGYHLARPGPADAMDVFLRAACGE
ncbi:Bacteriophytochrome cph2 [Thiorhodovibrio winogradskyi]|uniref:Bacteriophytochrome cph2 n=1 Tax=Thiorhodovibrio winogradskyi TaxID=77007 RepID=A0ABZ0SA08_9GAMM|nr:EAL domain-containing protein [Thiorhodovibrio winogradskyi]